MYWRLSRADFWRLNGEGNKALLKGMAERGEAPGLLLYVEGKPAGWCSIGPRQQYPALERSTTLKRVDDTPVWSIVCFFVYKTFRRKGVSADLLRGAIAYAAQHGATVIEGYPIDLAHPRHAGKRLTGPSGYMGIASVFQEVGFVEVGRASESQLIMRYTVRS
jgi:GNAT superfamily N-acetyltransferase